MQEKKAFEFYLYDKPTLVIIDWYNIWNRYKNIDLLIFFNYLKTYKDIYEIRFYQGKIKNKDWSLDIIENAKIIGYEVITKDSKYTKIDISKESYLISILKLLQDLLNNISENNSEVANKIYSIKERVEARLSRGELDTEYGPISNFLENDEDLYSEIFDFVENLDLDLLELNKKINQFKNEINKPIKKLKCDFDAEIARDIALNLSRFTNLILFSGDGDFASTVKFLLEKESKRVFTLFPQGSFGEIDYSNFNLIKYDELGKRGFASNFIARPIDHILDKITKKEPTDKSVGPDAINIANQDKKVKL